MDRGGGAGGCLARGALPPCCGEGVPIAADLRKGARCIPGSPPGNFVSSCLRGADRSSIHTYGTEAEWRAGESVKVGLQGGTVRFSTCVFIGWLVGKRRVADRGSRSDRIGICRYRVRYDLRIDRAFDFRTLMLARTEVRTYERREPGGGRS